MQRTKNIKLLIWFLLLTGITVAFIFYIPDGRESKLDRHMFKLVDTLGIDEITINQSNGELLTFKKSNGQDWEINNQYVMDQKMAGLMMAVLTSVEVSRQLSETEEMPFEKIKEKSNLVKIQKGGETILAFHATGNSTKTTSFFLKEGEMEAYVVNIPGYVSYVSGIFDLSLSDWRDKQVFTSSWSSLEQLQLLQLPDSSVINQIDYANNFYHVVGVKSVDTVKMMDYLESTTNLSIYQYLQPGTYEYYDSLAATNPTYQLTIKDLNLENSVKVHLFPSIDGDSKRLLRLFPSEELALIRESQASNLIVSATQLSAN